MANPKSEVPAAGVSAGAPAAKLAVVICPGFHHPLLTEQFVRSLPPFVQPHVMTGFPADPWHVFRQIDQAFGSPQTDLQTTPKALVAIGFSAGVVGLTGALSLWQQQGGQVARFFAIDGWGMPIFGLPVCRLSHDAFTHWSSLPLGAGSVNFYADPPVSHLTMWGASEQVSGWQVASGSGQPASDQPESSQRAPAKADREPITAAEFLRQQLWRLWQPQ